MARLHTLAARLNPNKTNPGLIDVVVENAHGVAASTDTGHDDIGLLPDKFRHLPEALFAHHRIEVTHHGGIGMRARHRANNVEGVFNVCHPVAHGLVQRVFKRL